MKIYQLELTSFCNMQCSYCPHPSMKRAKGHMSSETLQKCIEYAKHTGLSRLAIHHFGDPLLHPQLKDRLEQLASNGIDIEFSTNGLLLEKKLDTLLSIKTNIYITLSVHNWVNDTPDVYFYHLKTWQDRTQGTNITVNQVYNASQEGHRFHRWSEGADIDWDFHEKCFFLKLNYGVVLWNGDIVSCCIDHEGESVFSNIHSPDSLTAESVAWSRCRSCDLYGRYKSELIARRTQEVAKVTEQSGVPEMRSGIGYGVEFSTSDQLRGDQSFFDDAVLAQRGGLFLDALIFLYKEVLSNNQKNVAVLHGLALVLSEKGLFGESLEICVQARNFLAEETNYKHSVELGSDIDNIINKSIAVCNSFANSGGFSQALRILESLCVLRPDNIAILKTMLVLYPKCEPPRVDMVAKVNEDLVKLEPQNVGPYLALIEYYRHKKDVAKEIYFRTELIIKAAIREDIRTITRLDAANQIVNLATVGVCLDEEKVRIVENTVRLARKVWSDRPIPEGDGYYYHGLYLISLFETLNIRSVIDPVPECNPYPDIEFANSVGSRLSVQEIRETLAQKKVDVVFYTTADPVYVVRLARIYVKSVIKSCDVSFMVIVHVIGGSGRLPELAAVVDIADDRLIFSADIFPPENKEIISCYPRKAPKKDSVVYYQSSRLLWIGYILELVKEAPQVIVSDIDIILQRGVKTMLERLSGHDIVFFRADEDEENSIGNIGSRHLLAGLMLIRYNNVGIQFSRFVRHYIDTGLKSAGHTGRIPFFFDQTAVVLARFHLNRHTKRRIGYFNIDTDMNPQPMETFRQNEFVFFHCSMYFDFNLLSLPE